MQFVNLVNFLPILLSFCELSLSLDTGVFGCPGFENVPKTGRTAPRMNISKFPPGSMQLKGRNVLLKPTIFPFDLDCWASYPIDLEFSGQLTNQRVEVRNFVTGFTQDNSTSANCYRIKVTLTSYKEITGNYSCFDVANRTLISSRYIFAQSPPSTILLRSSEFITVTVAPQQKVVILPCAVSNPDFSKDVQLLKVNGTDTEWVLENPKTLKYDPKLGFIMTLSAPLDKTLGLYECRLGQPQDVVRVKLVGPPDFTVFPRTSRVIQLKQGDRLELECLSKTESVTFKMFPELELDQEMAENKLANGKLHGFYKNGKVLVSQPFVASSHPFLGRVECVRSSDNGMLYQWNYRVSQESRKTGLLDTSNFLNYCPPSRNSSSNELDIVLFECDNWVACKMSQCLRNDSTCRSNNHCVKKLCISNGIIQCPSDSGAHAEIFFTGFDNVKYTNWKSAETKNILRILPVIKTSALVTLMCEGTSFVVAGGFRWSLKLRNGTIVEIDGHGFTNDISTKETWGETRSILRNTLAFSPSYISTTLNNTDLIICSAPVWNSTEWVNQSMSTEDVLLFMERGRDELHGKPPVENFAGQLASCVWLALFTGTIVGRFCS